MVGIESGRPYVFLWPSLHRNKGNSSAKAGTLARISLDAFLVFSPTPLVFFLHIKQRFSDVILKSIGSVFWMRHREWRASGDLYSVSSIVWLFCFLKTDSKWKLDSELPPKHWEVCGGQPSHTSTLPEKWPCILAGFSHQESKLCRR